MPKSIKDVKIYSMPRETLNYHVIDNGEEFLDTWERLGLAFDNPQAREAWTKAIDNEQYGVLVGKIGSTIVSRGMICWTGPNPRETAFFETVAQNFPEQPVSPAVYGVAVVEDFKGRGYGHAIMSELEQSIVRNANVANRAVLTVRQSDEAIVARRMYNSRGYRHLEVGGITIFKNVVGEPDENGILRQVEVDAVAMAKDLK